MIAQSELPHKISDTVYSYTEVLYEQLTKYGPPAIPALQQKIEEHLPFSRPPPPPPPPPPTRLERVNRWFSANRYTIAGSLTVSAVGLGLVYYRYPQQIRGLLRLSSQRNVRRPARTRNGMRREAVGEC